MKVYQFNELVVSILPANDALCCLYLNSVQTNQIKLNGINDKKSLIQQLKLCIIFNLIDYILN